MVDYELNELRREFLAEAEAKVGEIQRALDEGRDAASLERLAYLAHQLKGSGGSYGYGCISSDAAEIEKAVERLAAGATDAEVDAKIQQHVVNLRSEIEKSARELATANA
jgi:HPt (histidine-containing phosphotransfer) domain-containing protein